MALDKFSSETQKIVTNAMKLAERRSSAEVQLTDLLTAVLQEGKSAAFTLQCLGLTNQIIGESSTPHTTPNGTQLEFSEEVKDVFRFSLDASQSQQNHLVSPQSLVYGMVKRVLLTEVGSIISQAARAEILGKLILSYVQGMPDTAELPEGREGHFYMLHRLLKESSKLNTMMTVQIVALEEMP